MRSFISCLLCIRCLMNTIFPDVLCWVMEWLPISLLALFPVKIFRAFQRC